MTVKTCPNPPKGTRCHKCGGSYICLFWKTHKKKPEQPKEQK